jgi:hypothetical protein
MNAAFDVYQVQNILDVGCVPRKCTAAQITQIEGYRRQFVNSSIAHLVARASQVGHGAYVLHEFYSDARSLRLAFIEPNLIRTRFPFGRLGCSGSSTRAWYAR